MKKYLADRGHAILLFLISLLFVNLYFGFICATRVNPGDLYYLDAAAGALALFLLAQGTQYSQISGTISGRYYFLQDH